MCVFRFTDDLGIEKGRGTWLSECYSDLYEMVQFLNKGSEKRWRLQFFRFLVAFVVMLPREGNKHARPRYFSFSP